MCGIVGYIGQSNARNIIIDGLKTLEYRGYDSAGAAFLNKETNEFELFKEVGRVSVLDHKTLGVISTIGIGHTRWATHGSVTSLNAHPHRSASGRFLIVHNGIIENYQELINVYLQDINLKSETDSEIIAQLIEKFSATYDVQTAIIQTLKLLHGSYAILVVDNENIDTLYAAKAKPPLLVGKGQDGYVVTSDALALVDVASEYFVMDDERLVVISQEDVSYVDFAGNNIEPAFKPVEFTKTMITRDGYDHYMLKEIFEQPTVIKTLIRQYFKSNNTLNFSSALITEMQAADRYYIIAAGTSMHAGLVGKELFKKLAGKPVEVHIASEFTYNLPLISEKPFFIFISQSGETADLRSALQMIKPHGYPTLTITNVPTSTLAREAKFMLDINAAPEICVAATKTYIGQVVMLGLLAYALSDKSFQLQNELQAIAHHLETFLNHSAYIKSVVAQKLHKANTFFIGRGLDYITALEGSLKLKEISYIHSEAFPAGELKHGAIALIEKATPVIAIISDPTIARNTRSNISEVVARGAVVLTIVTAPISKETDDIILPEITPLLSPLLFVPATQLVAYYAALIRGEDIDKPRNLAKSVTVE